MSAHQLLEVIERVEQTYASGYGPFRYVDLMRFSIDDPLLFRGWIRARRASEK